MNSGDVGEGFLRRAIGLDPATISPAAVAGAVRARMAARRLADPAAYALLLDAEPEEGRELIEEAVVPESWFFRDREAFAALAGAARDPGFALRPGGVLRVLSLPCSGGEEPYSAAMALLDAGLAPDAFRIDAADVSGRALARARRAVYGRNSFRGGDLAFRDRHFVPVPGGWRLADAVRERVRFFPGNLVDPLLLPGEALYDAVFCRNALIYLDAAARERVVALLDRLLAPGGLLFVGPSETALFPARRLVPARLPHAFALRREAAAPPLAPPRFVPAGPAPAPLRLPAPPPPGAEAGLLAEAAALADRGLLAEAAARCEAHLRAHGPTAHAYRLLGLTRDAAGDGASAEGCYRKALYLDPGDPEALAHLAALLAHRGEAAAARRLLDRARRAPTGSLP